MILRNDWMNDNGFFGSDYPNNIITSEAIYRFEQQKLSLEGRDALIDGQSERIVVQNHTNPINQSKYDKKCSFNLSTKAKTGSILEFDNEKWMVLSDLFYKYAYYVGSAVKCNNTLKFYDKSSILNTIISIPCVKEESKISFDNGNYTTVLTGKIIIQVPINPNTLTIYEGQRFILDNKVYEVEGTFRITNSANATTGILKLNMSVVEKDNRDNFETGIAWNDEVINNYNINIINGTTVSFDTTQTIQLNVEVLNNGNIVTPTPTLVYTSSNIMVCTVSNSGLLTGLAIGNCDISVRLSTAPTIIKTISVSVVAMSQHNYSVTLSGVNQILKNKVSNYSCNFADNGTTITRESVFTLFADDGITPLSESIAYISSQDSIANSCAVTTKSPSGIVYCKLVAKSNDGSIVSNPLRIKIYSVI